MNCTLCSETMVVSQTMRPNHATFECGHSFHLSCVLQYSKEKITNTCPICEPRAGFFADFGDDRLKAMSILIDKRRKANKMEKPKGFLWFGGKTDLRSKVQSGTSLHTLKLNGYIPESFVEENVPYKQVANTYTMASIVDFGFRFHHMLVMGFQPEDFKKMSANQLDELEIKATDMLQTSITIHELAELGLDLYKLCEMKWTWADLRKIGGNCQTIRLITPNISELKTYFAPSMEDWEKAGFTAENMEKYAYNVDVQIAKKKPVRRKQLSLGNSILF